jgi:hypothetical protein
MSGNTTVQHTPVNAMQLALPIPGASTRPGRRRAAKAAGKCTTHTAAPAEAQRPARAEGPGAGTAAHHPRTSSRYYAKLPPATLQFEDPRGWRAGHRLNLRQIQADDHELADRMAKVLGEAEGRRLAQRLKACGVEPLGDRVTLRTIDGAGYLSDLETCAKGQLCAVCSARMHAREAERARQWTELYTAQGGFFTFVTLTGPHQRDHRLRFLLDAILAGWDGITRGDWGEYRQEQGWSNWRKYPENWREIKRDHCWSDLRGFLGIDGYLTAEEITFGDWHGWHPHRHVLFFHDRFWGGEEQSAFIRYVTRMWSKGWRELGLGEVDGMHGIDFRFNVDAAGVSEYITKVQDNWTVAAEMTRADLKTGRRQSCTYFELLACYYATGDMEIRDLCDEYIGATRGLPILRSSPGLRDKIPGAEEGKSDEQLATDDVGGVEVGWVSAPVWRRVVAGGLMHGLIVVIPLGLPAVNDFLGFYECGRAHAPEEAVRDG